MVAKIARIVVNDENRDQVMNYIKINFPNYVMVDNYEIVNGERRFLSDKALLNNGLQGPTIAIEMEGDVTIKVKKEDYQKPGRKIVPVFLTEEDHVDTCQTCNEILREIRTINAPVDKVQSFQNFEIRNGRVHVREHSLNVGEQIFIIR